MASNPADMDEVYMDTRRIDELGRVVLPAAARALLGWQARDAVRVLVDPSGRIVLEREPERRNDSQLEREA